MAKQSAQEEFVHLLTQHQTELRGFILASLGNYANSQDVLQRTNVTLWKKVDEFRPGAPFLPWAFAIARFEILAFLRDHRRDRLTFMPDVAEMMCDASQSIAEEMCDREFALRGCIEQLSNENRSIVDRRYAQDQPIASIAKATERSIDGVKSLLLRIRKSLASCVERKLSLAGEDL